MKQHILKDLFAADNDAVRLRHRLAALDKVEALQQAERLIQACFQDAAQAFHTWLVFVWLGERKLSGIVFKKMLAEYGDAFRTLAETPSEASLLAAYVDARHTEADDDARQGEGDSFVFQHFLDAALPSGKVDVELLCPCCGFVFSVAATNAFFTKKHCRCPRCMGTCDVPLAVVQGSVRGYLTRSLGGLRGDTEKGLFLYTCAIAFSPLVDIFFCRFLQERIGHYFLNTMFFLGKLGQSKKPYILFAIPPDRATTCNQYLTRVWARQFTLLPCVEIAYLLAEANEPTRRLAINLRTNTEDISQVDNDGAAYLPTLTDAEKRRGREWLAKHGATGEDFICFFMRDRLYLKKYFPRADCSYHDHRDGDVNKDGVPVMNWFAEHDIPVFRVGTPHTVPLSGHVQGVFDFACTEYDEFIDLFLLTECPFYIGSNSGPATVHIFSDKTTLLFDNTAYYETQFNLIPKTYMLYKKFYDKRQGKILSFREIAERDLLCGVYYAQIFAENDIELISNTAAEILAAAREVYMRMKGRWKVTRHEIELQQKVRNLYDEYCPDHHVTYTIPYTFLCRYPSIFA